MNESFPEKFSVSPWIFHPRAIATHTREASSRCSKRFDFLASESWKIFSTTKFRKWCKENFGESLILNDQKSKCYGAAKAQHHPWQWKFLILSVQRLCVCVREVEEEDFPPNRHIRPEIFPSNENEGKKNPNFRDDDNSRWLYICHQMSSSSHAINCWKLLCGVFVSSAPDNIKQQTQKRYNFFQLFNEWSFLIKEYKVTHTHSRSLPRRRT